MVLSPVFEGSENRRSIGDAVQSVPPSQVEAARATYHQRLALPTNKLFGTDGIRGRFGDLLTPALAYQVGRCAGEVLGCQGAGPVVLGYDSRNSSEILAIALADGLVAAGAAVWNLGLCPTPAVAHLCHSLAGSGGVMISASHNPPEDNGLKFFGAAGRKLSAVDQAAIEEALRQGHLRQGHTPLGTHATHLDRRDLVDQYIQALLAPVHAQGGLGGLRVVLDLAWGAAAHVGAAVFQSLGAEVICLHDRPDGDRINVGCGSTHLHPLQAAVREHGADLGFGFDGDADRAIAVDGQGRVVDGDYILYLWGMALMQQGKLPHNLLVSTVMANLGFERAWEAQGGTLLRTAVGDQYVHAEMMQQGAMLGGEQSGHIICRHYGISGDGLQTAIHLAAVVKQAGLSLAELRDQSFQTYPQLLRNVRVEDRDRRLNWQNCDPLQRAIAQAEADMGNQGRVLVRASGTEPVIRVMVEAVSATLTEHWTTTLADTVKAHFC